MDNFARPDSHLVQQPAVRAAKQRRDAGARLDDREKEIMREYDRLEAADAADAGYSADSGGESAEKGLGGGGRGI
jgi:molybdenum-dependent DNA-binding transcriptional regulator ModE